MLLFEVIPLLRKALLWPHVVCGFLGLVAFWIPIVTKKGGRVHRATGTVFFWCAVVVGITAMSAGAWAVIDPIGFHAAHDWDESRQAQLAANLRFGYSILFFLAVGTMLMAIMAVRALRTKGRPEQFGSPLIRALLVLMLLTSAGLIAYAGNLMLRENVYGLSFVPLALGAVGVWFSVRELRNASMPYETKMGWWYLHMENMLGAGIAFHTAFFVLGINSIVDLPLRGAWQLLPWVLPTIIGVPLIHMWIRSYKRRFGELPT